MKLKMYQVDAFANLAFEGNPAAVIPLEQWLDEGLMQQIAEENNLSETVYFVPIEGGYHIRWFTPKREVKLCGHATLASAFVLFKHLGEQKDEVCFESLSGPLYVKRQGDALSMDFPAQKPEPCECPEALEKGLGVKLEACLACEDYVAVLENENALANLELNFSALAELDLRGVIATAPSEHYDFVSRFFAPKYGIMEDPVTGSAHTQLTPYWAERFGKNSLSAKQISARGGEVGCELKGDRVVLSGKSVLYMTAEIDV